MHKLLKTKWALLIIILFIAFSCIDEDLSECPSGLSVGFTYNLYNEDMEYADAFNNAVSEITLFVFDEEDNYISQYTEAGDILNQNGYRMEVCCLPSGSYQLLAWGGIDNKSFASKELKVGVSKLSDVLVTLNTMKDAISNTNLTPLFYGRAKLDNYRKSKYTKVEVPLVKNTNTFRILLQNDDNEEINPDAFTFEIIDKNTALNSDNGLASDIEVTYLSFAQGNASINDEQGVNQQINTVVFAELSTSKLFANNSKTARLRIYNKDQEREILNLPLIELVLMMKNDKFSKSLSNQIYLDRIHSFYMTFFLHNDNWMKTHIIVNDWVVRFNEIGDL